MLNQTHIFNRDPCIYSQFIFIYMYQKVKFGNTWNLSWNAQLIYYVSYTTHFLVLNSNSCHNILAYKNKAVHNAFLWNTELPDVFIPNLLYIQLLNRELKNKQYIFQCLLCILKVKYFIFFSRKKNFGRNRVTDISGEKSF